MKVLVIGSGGREHAIAWKLASSKQVEEVICIPGNGGTALEAKCRNVENVKTPNCYAEVAQREKCTLAVIGPEVPLALGVADVLRKAGILTVGPGKKEAILESSKDVAKAFMAKYGVSCAASKTFTNLQDAIDYIQKKDKSPFVIKADGLAAGKGVVIATSKEEAISTCTNMMEKGILKQAGSKVVIEEYLEGREISVLAAVDVTPLTKNGGGSKVILPFIAARDHKRLSDRALGPNTGGMGAVSPVTDFTPALQKQFNDNILQPTLRGMIEEGMDYRGFIFFGIMLTKNGPSLLEYNVRLGDPETQAVLPLMQTDFADLCLKIANDNLEDEIIQWKEGFAVSPVAVSKGYPASYEKGFSITIDNEEFNSTGAKIFIAGANCIENGKDKQLITTGGRVLSCCKVATTFDEAFGAAYRALNAIHFKGITYRHDIGLKGAAESSSSSPKG